MKKLIWATILVAAWAGPVRAQILERVLVKVNGDILTQTELEEKQTAAIRARIAGGDLKPDIAKDGAELKKAMEEVTPQLLVEAIDELLLLQMGKEKGYRLSDDQFKSWLENLRKEQNLQDDEKFFAALKQEGMTVDDLRKNVERQFLVGQVQRDEVGSKLSITEEEARQYYLAHKDEFVEPATVTLREVLLEVPTTTKGGQTTLNVGQEDEIKQQAAAVRARILAGEDFTKVAAEVSAAASKANGGLIGPIALSEVSPSLQALIATMKPGDVTEPLRVPRGFQILKLESLKPAAPQPFERVRDLVADRVHDARQQVEIRKFLGRMRGQAIIEWKNDELRKLYEKQVAQYAAPAASGL
ncbi:MAG: peptidyl-prolyl cis-trans isomerase [Acidobacteriota bacterium]|nr:peptidyl-prolyl cis-trans isomerase [Acidobacteriota bacterium]